AALLLLHLQPGDRRLPHLVATLGLQGDQRGLVAARRDDDHVAVDQRRFAVAEHALLAAVGALEVLLPQDRALVGADAGEQAVGRQDVDAAVGDGGRRARAGEAAGGLADLGGPQELAFLLGVEAEEVFGDAGAAAEAAEAALAAA